MRIINYFILLLVVFLFSCDTASNVEPVYQNYFIKYYGKAGDQQGVDIIVNDDGEMFLLGNSTFSSLTTPFIIKVDAQGSVLWQRQCGGSGVNERAVDIEFIKSGPNAGDLIVATNIGEESNSRIRLIRIDQENLQGIDSVELPLHEGGTKQIVKSVTALELEGGYAITGYTDGQLADDKNMDPSLDRADIFAYRIDENLNNKFTVLEQGGEPEGSGVRVFEKMINNNISYLVFGYSNRSPTVAGFSGFNFELLINNDDNQQLGGGPAGDDVEDQILFATIKTPLSVGTGYLMVGASKNTSGSSDVFLVKFNDDLQKILQTKIGLGFPAECVAAGVAESDGYYLLCNALDQNDIILLKVGLDGSEKWRKVFGAEGSDSGSGIAVLPDGRVAVVGTMGIETSQKIALIVLNQQGNLSK